MGWIVYIEIGGIWKIKLHIKYKMKDTKVTGHLEIIVEGRKLYRISDGIRGCR
jgi:hypothetical protein